MQLTVATQGKGGVSPQQIASAFERISDLYRRLGQEIESLDAMLNAGESDGKMANRLIKRFMVLWQGEYHEPYVPNWSKDTAQLKRVLRQLEPEEIEGRMRVFLSSKEPFYVSSRHPLPMFVASINKFVVRKDDDVMFLAAPPPDCRHRPQCRTDEEHTRRVNREMRDGQPF